MCISPITFKNKKTKELITVPCSKCMECKANKSNDWVFRMENELKYSRSANFLTLTYEDENLPKKYKKYPTLYKKHLQDFWKRVRDKEKILLKEYYRIKKVPKEKQIFPKLKYYNIGEYGGITHRPHYHAIVFNMDQIILNHLNEIWGHGFVSVYAVNTARIQYVTKYQMKHLEYELIEILHKSVLKPFSSMSNGIGKNYLKNAKWHTNNKNDYVMKNGKKQKIPRVYRDKIFTKLEREILNKKREELREKTEVERHERMLKKGIKNPFKHEVTLKENKIERVKKAIRRGKSSI